MPYASNSDLPAGVRKGLTEKQQSQYRHIVNKCIDDGKDEATCFKMANGVVKSLEDVLVGSNEDLDDVLAGQIKEVERADGTKDYQYVSSWEIQSRGYTQEEAAYSPVGGSSDGACSNCRWFISPARCALVSGEIAPNGRSSLWTAVPAPVEYITPVRIVKSTESDDPSQVLESESAAHGPSPARMVLVEKKKGVVETVSEKVGGLLKSLAGSPARNGHAAVLTDNVSLGERSFSVVQQKDGRLRFFATMSNQFKDRQKETFTEASHKEYADWAEGTGTYPELWLWHIPGSRFGQADWLEYADGFQLASGLIDEGFEPLAKALSECEEELGVSHGFVCLKESGTIHRYRSYELSPLPLGSAANEWTGFNLLDVEEKDMAFSEKRRNFLTGLGVSEETVKTWETNTEALGANLKKSGIEFKSTLEAEDEVDATTALAGEVAALAGTVKGLSDLVVAQKELIDGAVAAAQKTRDEILATELTPKVTPTTQGFQASQAKSTEVVGAPGEKSVAEAEWFERDVMGAFAGAIVPSAQ